MNEEELFRYDNYVDEVGNLHTVTIVENGKVIADVLTEMLYPGEKDEQAYDFAEHMNEIGSEF